MKMVYKDKNKQKKYQQEWYQRKQKGLDTRIVKRKEMSPKEIKESRNDSNKRHFQKKKRIIEVSLGSVCTICGSIKTLRSHRKDGKSHKDLTNISLSALNYEMKNRTFVKLCSRCHGCVHWCMRYLGMSWGQISRKNITPIQTRK